MMTVEVAINGGSLCLLTVFNRGRPPEATDDAAGDLRLYEYVVCHNRTDDKGAKTKGFVHHPRSAGAIALAATCLADATEGSP